MVNPRLRVLLTNEDRSSRMGEEKSCQPWLQSGGPSIPPGGGAGQELE